MLNLTSNNSLSLIITMKSTSAAQRASVAFLLKDRYSLCQIQAKTGLEKSTVGRIGKELELDKENHPGGHPAKLIPCDKQIIIRQITTGKLDTAVQVTKFINNVLPNPVHPQTIRNVLKKDGFRAGTKRKVPLLKKTHQQQRLKWALEHANWTVEDFKRILWTDETKINRIGSDGKVYVWKKQEESISD